MMALQVKTFHHLPPLTSSPFPSFPPLALTLAPPLICKPHPLSLTSTGIPPLPLRRRMPVVGVMEENQESPESESESKLETGESELASELKKAMQERKEKEGDNFWKGVGEEISEIEWPSFGKVLGTTGVVLGVIFGSSVVLLTVNAILAELSDKVFAGKGVQDFFT